MTALKPEDRISPLQVLADRLRRGSHELPFARPLGQVSAIRPAVIEVSGLSGWLELGSLIEVRSRHGPEVAEVVSLDRARAVCRLFEARANLNLGDLVHARGQLAYFPDESWRGRIIDGLGRAVDGGGDLRHGSQAASLRAVPPPAMVRQLVSRGLQTGVRVVDAFTPLCFGQRMGIFAGSGVGKSTLLSMLARSNAFDCLVVALVGERGREVREFVQHTLGEAASKAITVLATGDETPMMRRLAPRLAITLAEFFRDLGQDVLLVMDSVTRYAHACREIALSAGEPPVARGYPPSVFTDLPQLLERAGPGAEGQGSITGIFSVLIDGDDHNDPVADTIRGTLDGHIVLDRAIAEQGRYPAVNLLSSLSRLANRVWSPAQSSSIRELKRLVARFEDTRDLRAIGGYVVGSDLELDRAVAVVPQLYTVLAQQVDDPVSVDAFQEISAAISGGP